MKAYRLATRSLLDPFADHPLDCSIANKPLRQIQQEVLHSLGFEIVDQIEAGAIDDAEEHLIFQDRLYFTPALLQEFLRRSRAQQTRTVAALKPGLLTQRSGVTTQAVAVYPDRVEYELIYCPRQGAKRPPIPVVIDPDQRPMQAPIPGHLLNEPAYLLPITDQVLIQINHWTNLWWANLSTLFARAAELSHASPLQILALMLQARSWNRWRIVQQTNRIGRQCDIHPTAYIEGSIIGNNVRIGAGSVIRQSQVGDNTTIANNVTVELAVVGAGCTLMNGAIVQMSALYSGLLSMSRLISCALCGRDTFLGDGSIVTDYRLDGHTMSVIHEGECIDTRNTFVGSCLGHGVYLGAGCILSPGRIVPNGWRIAAPENRMIRSLLAANGVVPDHRLILPETPSETRSETINAKSALDLAVVLA